MVSKIVKVGLVAGAFWLCTEACFLYGKIEAINIMGEVDPGAKAKLIEIIKQGLAEDKTIKGQVRTNLKIILAMTDKNS
jgi:hypothetical protein